MSSKGKAKSVVSMISLVFCMAFVSNASSLMAEAQSLEKKLLTALENEKSEEARSLIAQGANPNAKDEYGISAIQFASINGDLETVKLLISIGAKTAVADDFGGTALFSAAERGHVEIVKLLLEGGADPNRKITAMGVNKTPLEIARERGHTAVVDAMLTRRKDAPGK